MANCTIRDGKYYAPNGAESILYGDLRKNMGQEEANGLFILSKTPSFITEVVKPLLKSHVDKVAKIPSNISFKETFVKGVRTFHIYDKSQKVGRMQLVPNKEGFKVKSSLINESKRGNGYGTYLYAHAISKMMSENSVLYTDTTRTEGADSIWNRLRKEGVSTDGRTVRPQPSSFDKNGEVSMRVLLEYVDNTFSTNEPLSAVEKSHLINLGVEGINTSDDLYTTLYSMFFKDGLFNPNVVKMKKLYSEDEIQNILSDSEVLGVIRETIDKLRNTEVFDIPQISYKKEFDYRSPRLNILGQYKKENPLRLEKESLELEMSKVPVIDERGEVQKTKLIFEKALKIPTQSIMRALRAVVNAHPLIDTSSIENKLIKSFKNFGLNIEKLSRENYSALLNYLEAPTDLTREVLEDSLGFMRQDATVPVDISLDRTYQYLKTSMTEQEIFDKLSLIRTDTPNVYHKVTMIDEGEMRSIQKSKDLSIPEYQLYKDYYKYSKISTKPIIQTNIETSLTYLKGDFIADFAIDKLKNPTEFNRQFEITDSGIRLISEDIITLQIVKSYIQDGGKYAKEMADYSLLNKEMLNLKEPERFTTKTVTEARIEAVNNVESVPIATTLIDILDENSIHAPLETAKFLRVGDQLYEQQSQGNYVKLEVNKDVNFYEMYPKVPQGKNFEIRQIEEAKSKTSNLITKDINDEHFSCE